MFLNFMKPKSRANVEQDGRESERIGRRERHTGKEASRHSQTKHRSSRSPLQIQEVPTSSDGDVVMGEGEVTSSQRDNRLYRIDIEDKSGTKDGAHRRVTWNEDKGAADTRDPDIIIEKLEEDLRREIKKSKQIEKEYLSAAEKERTSLNNAHKEIYTLRQTIRDNDAVVTRAHQATIALMAGDVSRSYTDDMAKSDLKKFFQGDFLAWCSELSVVKIDDVTTATAKMQSLGNIINIGDPNTPSHLLFRIDSCPDSSYILLRAALAHTLHKTFLSHAYFLAKWLPLASDYTQEQQQRCESDQLLSFELSFSKTGIVQSDAAIDWRIQTVQCLENAVPLSPDLFTDMVRDFIQEYQFLLKPLEHKDEDDLRNMFFDFSLIALKLWKLRTRIQVHSMPNFANHAFQLHSHWIQGEVDAVAKMGDQLNGRPIGVIIHPLILSLPIVNGDSETGPKPQEIVWLKALAWVSTEENLDIAIKEAR